MKIKFVLASGIALFMAAAVLCPGKIPWSGEKAIPPSESHPTKALPSSQPHPAAASTAAQAPAWPPVSLAPLVGGLELPVHITHAGDGSGRLFVVEQPGRVRIIRNGVLLSRPFLAIESRVIAGGERGLLSVAFPPGFGQKRYFYVDYTRQPDGASVVSRFRLTADNDLADAASEEMILTVAQPFVNHKGGQLAFGPKDGFLYIGLGDGGSGGDPFNNAQNPDALLGKILRIDTESGVAPYAIPASNPFVGRAGFRPEIWATGLRNPWRYSFDRVTGDLYIADVGQDFWEEIDFQAANSDGGSNYGWRILEGAHCYNPPSGCVPPASYSAPVAEYDHSQGCAVVGGFVYRGAVSPSMQGIYFYSDNCSGPIWGLRKTAGLWETTRILSTTLSISSFGEDEAGNLYLSDLIGGNIYALQGDPGPSIAILSPAAGATVSGIVGVAVEATDNGAIARVEFAIDGALKTTDTAAPYSFDWDTAGYPNGSHKIKATAYDDLGQPNSHEITVTVGNLSLTILAGPGGTTNPPPGTYSYERATAVNLTALPSVGFGFKGWSGDASGRANPITVTVDGVKTATATFIKIQAPLALTAARVLNRSLSQAESIVVLRWQGNPANENIAKYRIYRLAGAERILLAELRADVLTYWHRKADKNGALTYAVVAVDDQGREGETATAAA